MGDTDVLIVGGGPVGTMLALELALQGVSFRIIDKEPARSDKSRALVVQPRTLELLNRHGAAQELVQRGNVAHGASLYLNRSPAVDVKLDDFGSYDTEFRLPLMISQCETEHFLDACLEGKHGRKVERPLAAKHVVQDEAGVTVTLGRPDNSEADETIRAKYVVGCDGAHSVVRHAAKDLRFEGASYPQAFVLCDCRISDSSLPLDRWMIFLGSRGANVVFPLAGGLWRVIASGPGLEGDEDPTLAMFADMWERVTPPGSGRLHDPAWLARFHLHHRGVSRYRDRRLFVAGDAAHIHSPAGGQGMNTGMQDAINLGWKLARVLRGDEPDAFLDSYDAERRPVGQKLLRNTDQIFSYTASTNPIWLFVRPFILRWLVPWFVGSPSRRAQIFRFISEFGVNYRGSPIVGTASGFAASRGADRPIQGGDRLPDGKLQEMGGGGDTSLQRVCVGPSYHLVLFSGLRDNSIPADAAAGTGDSSPHTPEQKVLDAAALLGAAKPGDVEVHIVWGPALAPAASASAAPSNGDAYIDPDGHLHAQYGMAGGPGYVWVRPDGYVAHIGGLENLGELLAFVKGAPGAFH